MKIANLLSAAIVFPLLLRAADFPPATQYNTLNATLLSVAASTNSCNATGSAVWVEAATQHTFQWMITNNTTNPASVYLDRSLNGTNWIPFATNTATANTTADTTLSGKYAWLRARFTGTNAGVVVIYLGGK